MKAHQPGLFWAATRVWDRQHGPGIDDTYLHNRRGMQGLRYCFTYHWLEPGTPIETQVARVWYCMQGFIAQGEGVMLDVEESGVTAEMTLEFCKQMEGIIHRPVAVYSGLSSILSSQAVFDGERPLIFPHYTPNIQESRTLARIRGARYLDAVQWSSTGQVAGVATRCDLDQIEVLERFERSCGW